MIAAIRRWLGAHRFVIVVTLVGVVAAGLGVARGLATNVAASLEAQYTAPIEWWNCGHEYRCGSVKAPLDWNDEASGSVTLALLEHRATGASHGAIVVNPGGPGASGTSFVGSSPTAAVDGTVAKDYDVIGFDPRGVGYSSAVKCYDDADMDRYLYTILPGKIGSSAWLAADRKAARGFADACEKHSGRLLAHVDTTSTAHDLDLIRADLGEAKLNYIGYSYGSYLGTIYAGLFPGRVGRFVLDGADDPWADTGGGDGTVAQMKAFEGDLKAYMTACLRGSAEATGAGSCPFFGSTDSALVSVTALLDRVAAHPLTASDGRRLGAATLSLAIITPLYDTSDWPDLTEMFRETIAGRADAAFALADAYNDRSSKGRYEDNLYAASTAIDCLESGSDDYLPDMRHQAKELEKAAPVLGIYSAYGDILCSEWPVGPVEFPAPVTAKGAGPIVVVGTTGDPATPYAGAVALAKQLDSGHLVTYVGEGHTAYDKGDSCVNRAIDAYLIDETVPAPGLRCH
ncbi:MAG: alpha/beta hydrolase [Frondihabitans sp.]|nr:alpha/beta hydrolase [Frondihabitans sp.]